MMAENKLTCPNCGEQQMVKNGFTTNIGARKQRYLCKVCTKDTTTPREPEEEVPMRTSVPKVSRYIVTTAQNATPIHKDFWAALQNCAEHYKAELIVIPSRYKNPTSKWTEVNESNEWWVSEVMPYLVKGNITLHQALMIVNTKVQFTAANPLTSMETLTGDKSGIVGHPRIALKSVATPQHTHPKMMYTTGVCTVPNYTDTKAGHIGKFHHSYGALIVECADDRFHVRQLAAMQNGSFCDLGKEFTKDEVRDAKRPLGLTMGDTHWVKIDPDVYQATFKSMIPELRPHHLIWHDLLDQYARNHHHKNNWMVDYKKHINNEDCMRTEVEKTLWGLIDNTPDDCLSVVVSSNHDRALNRWLMEADFKKDPKNAEFYIEMVHNMITTDVMADPFIEYGRQYVSLWGKENIKFLDGDESFMLNGVEHCLHGDIGTNGSRGTTKNLSRIGVKVTKAHNHTAEIIDGCYSVGKSTGKLEYEAGPSSHSNTHCLQYYNGKRALITIINGKWKI
jgi:predicted SprT family Zn-dependent metalloprotease